MGPILPALLSPGWNPEQAKVLGKQLWGHRPPGE